MDDAAVERRALRLDIAAQPHQPQNRADPPGAGNILPGADFLQAGIGQPGARIAGIACVVQMQGIDEYLKAPGLGDNLVEDEVVGKIGRNQRVIARQSLEKGWMITQNQNALPILRRGPGCKCRVEMFKAEG